MSTSQLRLASFILKEHYGEIVEEVGLNILRKGWTTLASLKQDTNLDTTKIKKALCVLIQHNLVKFQKSAKNQVCYSAELASVFTILEYPKFTYSAKILYGDAAELLIEELLHHGSLSMTQIVRNVTHRLLDPALNQSDKTDHHHVARQFEQLVQGHFIKRILPSCPASGNKGEDFGTEMSSSEYCLPEVYVYQASGKRKLSVNNDVGPAAKRRKGTNEHLSIDFKDEDVLWHVNFVQFHHHLVNEMIENAVKNRIDEFAAELVKVMLKVTMHSRDGYAAQTKSVSVYDITENLPSSSKIGRSQIVQYLNLLENDQVNFVSKTAENCGGMYAVNDDMANHGRVLEMWLEVAQDFQASPVEEASGTETSTVEELIMVPSKEVKELLYNLLTENFITLQEIPRTSDYAPSRTFYLFSVNISHVCRMLLERSCKVLGNLVSRRHHETEEYRRLVEKSEKLEAAIMGLKSQGMDENSPAVQELDEMMTDQEKQQLKRLKSVQSKLEQSELQVGDSVFVFTQHLALNS